MCAVCAESAGVLCARAYAAFDELFDAMSETKTFAMCSRLLVPKPKLHGGAADRGGSGELVTGERVGGRGGARGDRGRWHLGCLTSRDDEAQTCALSLL